MKIEIKINCPSCKSGKIVKNGKKAIGTQNYLCKDCGKQFIAEQERKYVGTSFNIDEKIKLMTVRGSGVRDISVILKVSIWKVLKVLRESHYELKPKKKHYENLEIDELWTFVESKSNKVWIIYAYDRSNGEIVAYVDGKRDTETARKLRQKIIDLGVTYGKIYTDNWESFIKTFNEDEHNIGKKFTVGIEGNNCKLRHRIRRIFRRTCCFSKRLLNHLKVFNMAVFYINFGFV
jgi:IS1 family transposase/transposase-like protein